VSLVACGPAGESTPPVDFQAEEQRLLQMTDEWYAAENNKDLEGVMKFMSEDCILQAPGMPALEGHEAIRAFMVEFYKILVNIEGKSATIVFASSGDFAFQHGTSTAVLELPEGQIVDPQKYLFVWKKIDGDWKTVAGTFSSDRSM